MKTWASPLLRWAGSKRALLPELASRWHRAEISGRYIEPFAGSACLFFALHPRRAVLGDLNGELVATYETLRDHPRLLSRAVRAWDTDRDSYYLVRGLDPAGLGEVERAARFLFLNRLCFNGVFRTNKAGHFNVPYGRATGAIPSEAHIYRCSVALREADLRAGDFDATTADVRAGDFVYLDPPYTQDPRSAYGVYGYGSFDGGDLERVLRTLGRIDQAGATFLFSYAAIDGLADSLPPSWSLAEVTVPGRVAARTRSRTLRTEVLVSNVAAAGPIAA
jgi:DNA adenine methylase